MSGYNNDFADQNWGSDSGTDLVQNNDSFEDQASYTVDNFYDNFNVAELSDEQFYHYLGGQDRTGESLMQFVESLTSSTSDKPSSVVDAVKKVDEVGGKKDEESLGAKLSKGISDLWKGLDGSGRSMLIGMGMKGVEGMLTYNDKKKLQQAQAKSSASQSSYYDAKTAETQAQMANQAGIGNMRWGNGMIPQYQQVTINRPKVGA